MANEQCYTICCTTVYHMAYHTLQYRPNELVRNSLIHKYLYHTEPNLVRQLSSAAERIVCVVCLHCLFSKLTYVISMCVQKQI